MALTDFSDSCEWVPPATSHRPTTAVLPSFQAAKAKTDAEQVYLSQLTTIGVGGKIADFRRAESEKELVESIEEADRNHLPLLVLGGGSNLLCDDTDFPGIVLQDRRREITVIEDAACGGAIVRASAGQPWDEFVCACINNDQMGLESLSGIPGSVGAAPVQNIGAYGHEVAQTLVAVKVYDRAKKGVRKLPAGQLQLGYRTSIIKQSINRLAPELGAGRTWGPTGRFVVLEAEFQLRHASLSLPIKYQQLAQLLEVEMGQRVDLRDLREAVLELRRSKGMVLDLADCDTHSCGSFFTNPILKTEDARQLPEQAPKFPVHDLQLTNSNTGQAPVVPGLVKTSAAWLIEHAGFHKGFSLNPSDNSQTGLAGLSTKHVLALTNRGGARAKDIFALCAAVQTEVYARFGVKLSPEPVVVKSSPSGNPFPAR